MKEFKFKINGNLFEVSVDTIDESLAEVVVNGKTHRVELLNEIKTPKPKPIVTASNKVKPVEPPASSSKAGSGPRPSGSAKPILSPLPGIILELKINEGDIIKKGDVVLVMEAMKMENNILAEIDGTVSSIKVSKGQAVMQNDVLVEIA